LEKSSGTRKRAWYGERFFDRMSAMVNLGLHRFLLACTLVHVIAGYIQIDLLASESDELLRDRNGVHCV
jgi:hypothetical protein